MLNLNQSLYIDLGTANTLIYQQGHGLLLNEPSMLASRCSAKGKGNVVALGADAKKMLGKTPQQLRVFKPLCRGVVADTDRSAEMLHGFARRLKAASWWRRPKVVISLPCVVTQLEREAVSEIGRAIGARKVQLIEEPMAAAIGAGLPVFESTASMVVDIGGGTTEIAVVSCGGIVYARAVRVGGNDMDQRIITYLRDKYHFVIGEQTAERIKQTYGRAYVPYLTDPIEHFKVAGRDLRSGLPVTRSIPISDLAEAIEGTVGQIVELARAALREMPPEILNDIYRQSIVLAGGGALLKHLAARLQNALQTPVKVSSDPLLTTALGGFQTLQNGEILERVALQV